VILRLAVLTQYRRVTDKQTHMDCTVEYNGLLHRWVRRWAMSPILDEQTLLHRSHGHAVLVLLTTWCLRAARFLCRLATRASSKAAMAVRHVERHCPRSCGALMSDCGSMPHLFKLSPTVSSYRLPGPHFGRLPDESCP